MQSISSVSKESSRQGGREEPGQAAVYATLASILESQPFRTSRQCQNLLQYVVDHSLRDDDSSLRERIIGVEVFGRSPDYDTSEDPVVRMRAADVRKRLAQFYQANGHTVPAVLITLKPGSYRATFYNEHEARTEPALDLQPAPPPIGEAHGPEESRAVNTPAPARFAPIEAPAVVSSHPPRHESGIKPRFWWIAAALLILLLGVVGRLWIMTSKTAQQRFWAPLTRSNQPLLLYVGANAVYRFTPEYLDAYQKAHGLKENGPEFFVDLPKGGTISADDLMPVHDTFISVAELAASAQVISLMHLWNKPFNLRSAADLSMGDIRNVPAILIGGFNNPWTLETTNDLPFSFRNGTRIENRKDPAHGWVVTARSTDSSREDYALISRILRSNTGGPVLSIGGIGSFGTQAAAEFVANPDKMQDVLKSAPPGWEAKNVQIVLRIKVVQFTPVAVDVAATTYW